MSEMVSLGFWEFEEGSGKVLGSILLQGMVGHADSAAVMIIMHPACCSQGQSADRYQN